METKDIVRGVSGWLVPAAEIRQVLDGVPLGMKLSTFNKEAKELGLTQADVHNLLYLKKECGASIPNALKLFEQGNLEFDEICAVYRARCALTTASEGKVGKCDAPPSFGTLIRFAKHFDLLDDGEEMAQSAEEVVRFFRKLQFKETALKCVTDWGERLNLRDLGELLESLDQIFRGESYVVDDDD